MADTDGRLSDDELLMKIEDLLVRNHCNEGLK